MDVLDVTEDVATIYGEIVIDLRKAGTPMPANDIWIAAVAARHGVPVLTYDPHFPVDREGRSHRARGSTVVRRLT